MLVDRRQPDQRVRGDRYVVVADHGDIGGAETWVRDDFERREREGVVPGEDSGRTHRTIEQTCHGVARVPLGGVDADDLGVQPAFPPELFVHPPASGVRVGTGLDEDPFVVGDVCDPRMTGGEQVLHHQAGPLVIVSEDDVVVAGAVVLADLHDGHALSQVFEPGLRYAGGHGDDPVDLSVVQALERRRAADRIGHGGDDELVVRLAQGVHDARQDAREEAVVHARQLNTDRRRGPAHGAGGHPRPIAEGLDRGGHAFAHPVAHPVGVADDLRDGRPGHAGVTGDIVDGRRPDRRRGGGYGIAHRSPSVGSPPV